MLCSMVPHGWKIIVTALLHSYSAIIQRLSEIIRSRAIAPRPHHPHHTPSVSPPDFS